MTKKDKKQPFRIEEFKLSKLKKAPYNPGEMIPSEYLKLEKSVKTFKDLEPIAFNVNTNEIIDGHHRLDVYTERGIEDVYVLIRGDLGWIFTKDEIKIKDQNHMKAMNLVLRKVRGEFSFPKLEGIFTDLKVAGFDLELTGFDELEIEEILVGKDFGDEPDDNDSDKSEKKTKVKEPLIVTCPDCGHEFTVEDEFSVTVKKEE